jgi:hypothetical protein
MFPIIKTFCCYILFRTGCSDLKTLSISSSLVKVLESHVGYVQIVTIVSAHTHLMHTFQNKLIFLHTHTYIQHEKKISLHTLSHIQTYTFYFLAHFVTHTNLHILFPCSLCHTYKPTHSISLHTLSHIQTYTLYFLAHFVILHMLLYTCLLSYFLN